MGQTASERRRNIKHMSEYESLTKNFMSHAERTLPRFNTSAKRVLRRASGACL